ncbi:MAG: hypothetical protein ACRCT1_12640 [Microcoleaceae cyanobacterium]
MLIEEYFEFLGEKPFLCRLRRGESKTQRISWVLLRSTLGNVPQPNNHKNRFLALAKVLLKGRIYYGHAMRGAQAPPTLQN